MGGVSASWRAALALAVLAVTGPVLTACGSPGDLAAYREEASTSVAGASSSLATIQVALQQWAAGRSPSPATSVLVGDADTAMSGVVDGFAALDPPEPRADEVRSRVLPVLDRAEQVAAEGRTALSRNDIESARQASEQMQSVLDDLDATAVTLR
jgi:hypothetical protein